MKKHIKEMYRNHNASSAALILRIALALVFITEGWMKITNIGGTEQFFSAIGLTSHFWVYLVGYTEFIGGLLFVIGFLIKPVCVALAIDMAVVIFGLSKGGLFWGHAYEFYILLTLLTMYALGAGKYSLAHVYMKERMQK